MKLAQHIGNITEARSIVEKANADLKLQYRGIDDVIDKIGQLIIPWMAIQDSITRPLTICLWGMTGTGKTSIVRNLVSKYLEQPLIEIDLGLFNGSGKDFSNEFYLNYSDYSGSRAVILLDEIQNPRTIREDGSEIDRTGLRGLWSLLSDGIIVPDAKLEKAECISSLKRITEAYDERKGAPPKKSSNKSNQHPVEFNSQYYVPYYEDEEDEIDCYDLEYNHRLGQWEIDSYELKKILAACNKKGIQTQSEINKMLSKDFRGTLDVLMSWLQKAEIQPVLDFSKCLIFITGNLDEAYSAANTTSPDVTADDLYDWSKSLSVPDIKQALLKRFRAEQVARLGNNHVLYPALSEKAFREIIRDDLKRISDYHSKHFDVNFKFSQSAENLIYAEGVFPTQGARSVLATTSSLAESPIPICLEKIIEKLPDKEDASILVEMSSNPASVSFFDESTGDLIFDYKLSLSIENLRRPVYDSDHVITAIHEAGHVMAAVVLSGTVPVKVSAFSPDTNPGYVDHSHKDTSRMFLKCEFEARIIGLLCGWAAEKVFFGEDFLSVGSSGDIFKATSYTCDYVRKFGFLNDQAICLAKMADDDDRTAMAELDDEKKIKSLLTGFSSRAIEFVKQYEKPILALATVVISKSNLHREEIISAIEQQGIKITPRLDMCDIFEKKLKENGIKWDPK